MNKAFIFTYDIIILLFCFCILFLSFGSVNLNDDLDNFVVIQKQYDLARIWSMETSLDKNSITRDFCFFFYGKRAYFYLGKEEFLVDCNSVLVEKSNTIEIYYIDDLSLNKLTFVIYY